MQCEKGKIKPIFSGLKIGRCMVASGELKLTRATKSQGLNARCATMLQNFEKLQCKLCEVQS